MLYSAFISLSQTISGLNVFRFITFRTAMAVLTALVMSLLLGPRLIRYLQERQIGEVIRDDGPQSHMAKKGTPTMGGLLILLCVALPVLLWNDLANGYIWLALFVLLAYGLLGFWDDYRKVMLQDKNWREALHEIPGPGNHRPRRGVRPFTAVWWEWISSPSSCFPFSRTCSPTSGYGSCPMPPSLSCRRATP